MNQGWTYREQIKAADAGKTVLDYYSHKYRHSTQKEWQAKINSGQVLLNGKPATTTSILKTKDKLAYHRQPWIEPKVPLKFTTIYEDSELLLINGPLA